MTTKATSTFCFRGTWYPIELVRQAACKAYDLPEKDFQEPHRLQELVDAVIRGVPTKAAMFIAALNEGKVK